MGFAITRCAIREEKSEEFLQRLGLTPTGGELPESFPAIREAMEQAQLAAGGDEANVDYIFEIPLQVAQSLVGFKHDEDCAHLLGKNFSVMSQITTPPAEDLLRRLFRKR